jgi:TolB-like protein/Flp pilus assembly protein TadD
MDESGKSGESGRLEGPGGPGSESKRPVFISYASADVGLAQKVCSALETAGIRCWIAPRDVVPGTLYADGIVHALDDSTILVLVLSKDAIASAHVGRELERASSKRHPVIALKVDAAPLTPAFEYFLNQSQWIDAGAGGIDCAISKLVEAVGRHLAAGTAAAGDQTLQASVRYPTGRRKMWWGIAAAVVFALVATYFLAGKAWLHGNSAAAPIVDKSIAVLPFVDMSEKKDQEYFGDGMAEEIIDLLVKIPGLKVISRTSSFQFKGKTEDLRTIGTQLGVAYVLEGSVRRSGDHLRVTAQLINAQDGTHLWSQAYDRDLSDVLKMQDEIALTLVRALQIEVDVSDFVSRPALRNTEAYTTYLQGWHADDRADQQGLEQAVGNFQRALELDPTFAAAEVGLADAYFDLGIFGFMPPALAFEKARRAAENALKLDPKLGVAHAQLGDIHRAYDRDWTAAAEELKQAQELTPNDSAVLFTSAALPWTLGRWDDALKLTNAALARDPLNPTGYENLSQIQLRRGRVVDAEEAQRRVLAIRPTGIGDHYFLGLVLLARGEREVALAEMLKESDDQMRLGGSAMAYFMLGRKVDSDAALAQMIKSPTHRPFFISSVYAFRGQIDEALKWLDTSDMQGESALLLLKSQTMFDKLEGDPRYKAFLRKKNLPDD